MPLSAPPGAIEKMRANQKNIAADGISSIEKSNDKVRNFFEHAKTAEKYIASKNDWFDWNKTAKKSDAPNPEVYSKLSEMKLTFTPAILARATLLAATPSGTKINGNWTGVERFFRLPGEGLVQLTEIDLKATNGKLFMLKESMNARINGAPAVAKIVSSDDGQTIEEIVWMNGNTISMLKYSPDSMPDKQGLKAKVANHVSGLSLAQELR